MRGLTNPDAKKVGHFCEWLWVRCYYAGADFAMRLRTAALGYPHRPRLRRMPIAPAACWQFMGIVLSSQSHSVLYFGEDET